jgi:hypothetical protein
MFQGVDNFDQDCERQDIPHNVQHVFLQSLEGYMWILVQPSIGSQPLISQTYSRLGPL